MTPTAPYKVLETGEPITGLEIEGETAKAPGVMRVWRVHYYPAENPEGQVESVGVVVEEITEQKRSEQHLRLVMEELNHRGRNTLAVVLSIASQMLHTSASLSEFGGAFIGRIRSLADTHTLLTRTSWRSADLRELIRGATHPYCWTGHGAVETEGPDVVLVPSAALALSLVLHELTTNAAKYGALSSRKGRVRVSWVITNSVGGSHLHLHWVERGGPKVRKPSRRGFGSDLIEFTIRHEFAGTSTINYYEDGVRCDIIMPWDKAIGWLHEGGEPPSTKKLK